MQEIPHILGFTSGELTPWLESRFDLQAYRRGAALIRNFIVQPYGGVQRRRGSAFVGPAGSQEADAVRLFAFSYSDTDSLMLEFYPGAMRVYREGELLMTEREDEEGVAQRVPYVLEVPWTRAEQVRSLRFTQVNDAVYVTCPSHPPVVLYRMEDTKWKCEEVEFESCPRATYTAQQSELTMERRKGVEEVTLTLPEDSDMTFTPGMAGREYVMLDTDVPEETMFRNQGFSHLLLSPMGALKTSSFLQTQEFYRKDATTGYYRFWTCIRNYTPEDYAGSDDPADYPAFFKAGVAWYPLPGYALEVSGDWELRTTGTWNAQLELWRTYDSPSMEDMMFFERNPDAFSPYLCLFPHWDWHCVKSFGQSAYSERQNWALSGTESRPCRMCVVLQEADSATLGALLLFRRFRSTREHKFLITEVTDAHTAKARPVNLYADTPYHLKSRKWSFGAFGEYNGYPTLSSYSGGRLWFGGMRRCPTTLLGSVVDDFHNFRMTSEDDSALNLTIASDNQSRICWLAPARGLLVGTSDGVWMLGGGDGGPLTPSNAAFRRQTSVGCENMPALAVEGCVLFSQRCGKRLREISYKLESDGFSATDLSLLSEHLLAAGIREYAVQEGVGSYIWAVMQDGSAAVLTLHGEQQVAAWQQVRFPGRRVLHVAALPRSGAELDEVWLVLRHESNGAVSLERVNDESPFLDGSVQRRADAAGCVSGLEHWRGQEVLAKDDSGREQRAVVTAEGTLEGLTPEAAYTVGVPYLSELQTMPMESEMSYNSVREFSRVRLRLLESALDFEYKAAHAARWESGAAAARLLQAPYSGSLRLDQMPDAGVGQGFCLRCGGTDNFRLLALSIEVDHHGK